MDSQPALNFSQASLHAWVKSAAGWLLAVACLAWVFHGTHPEQMWGHIRTMRLWWLVPAVLLDLASYVCEGARWHYLLRPVGRLPVLRATQAIYVGLFTNEVTPLRLGEVVRTYLAARWMDVSIARVVPSMLVSRLIDGVWLALAVGVVAIFVPLPQSLLTAADVLGVLAVASALCFLLLVKSAPGLIQRWAAVSDRRSLSAKAKSVVGRLGLELIELGDLGRLTVPALFSLAILACQAASFWSVMRAYHMDLPPFAGAAVYLIVHFGTAIPNAPANVGSFQFFTVLGLGLFGVEKTLASGFSVVVFLVLTLPLWFLGLLALSRTGLTLAAIRSELRRAPGTPGKAPLDPTPRF
jgi:glycosyltransferase 2 family protein